jgi:MFS family permease
VQHRHRPARFGMPREEPVEQQAREAFTARLPQLRDRMQLFLIRRLRPAAAIANPVQADVGRDPIEKTRRIACVQPAALLEHAYEHVLTCVERFVLVAKQLAATSQHHRSVAAAERIDVQLVHHVMGITPERVRSATLQAPVTLPTALQGLTGDGWLLFATRFIRLFAYGSLSVVLVLYLVGVGLTEPQVGLVLSLTLFGDTLVSLFITTRADRFGRRRMLVVGALLMSAAGLAFASASVFWILVIAGVVGVISPSGQEVGPFLPIEQASLSHTVSARARTDVFAWYTLTGAVATATGALTAGLLTRVLSERGWTDVGSYRTVVVGYALLGALLAAIFLRLTPAAEAAPAAARSSGARSLTGVHQSRDVVFKLSALFALDAFGGGFVVQSFAAYWFHLRFGVDAGTLGSIFFWANIFAGLSALLASRLAARIGLIKTMVWTHLPSNILLIMVPLMPTLPLAIAVLLVRFSISQMDVPTRQSYTMAVVTPEERSAAAGITGVARTTGAAISPAFVGLMFANPALINLPFFIAGTLKIMYDLLLYRAFIAVRPPEET